MAKKKIVKTKRTPAQLTAQNLKDTLWTTLREVRSGAISSEKANAVATQSREIMRVVAYEFKVAQLSNRKPTVALIGSSRGE